LLFAYFGAYGKRLLMSPHQKVNVVEESSVMKRQPDDATFESFFKKNFIPLCAYCQYKFGFDLDQAKDIVQASFLKIWEARQGIAFDLLAKAYLFKTVSNKSLDMLRREKVKQKGEKQLLQNGFAGEQNNGFDQADFKRLSDEIDLAVSELPVQMRKVFELCRFEGLKYAEIAGLLGISVKTVETQMSRALAKLRKKLSQHLMLYLVTVVFNL